MDARSAGSRAAIVALLCAGLGAFAAPADTQRPPYWRERTSFFSTFGRHADVVMLGDSLTDGAEWREMFPQVAIVNRGIDNDTTDGVLARLDGVVQARPRQVFVMIGINDLSGRASVDAVLANYRAIVARLERAGIQVFIESTLPCNEAKGGWKSCKAINGRVRQLNAQLAGLASPGVTFVDLAAVLTDAHGVKDAYTFDGVHLNGEGYRRWQEAIAPYMPGAVQRPRIKP